jgi:hypothetical protein
MKKQQQTSTYITQQDVEDRLIIHQSLEHQNASKPHRITYDFNIFER